MTPCLAQNAPPANPGQSAGNGADPAPLPTLPDPSVPISREQIVDPLTLANPSAGLTLPQLEAMAVQCNPTLSQAVARVQAARGNSLQVGLYPNPVLSYQGAEIGNVGRAGQQGGFVGQQIVTAGKLGWNRAVADQETQQAECMWEAQRFRVLTDVRRGFYDVLIAQRTVELTEQLVDIGQKGVQATESLLRAKEAGRADVLQARIEADTAKIHLEKARCRYLASWRSLAAVIGDATMQSVPLAGDLREGVASYTWDDTLNRLLAESPELASARLGVARAEAALNRECAGRTPDIDVQTGVQFDNATGSTIAGLQIGMPLQIYNRNQGNIRKAQAELVAAQQEVLRMRLALQRRLAVVFEQYAAAQQQAEKYARDILPNASESLKLVSAGYRQGEFGFLMFLTAEKTYFQTTLAYLDSLSELHAAAAEIEGNLLSDSLLVADSLQASPQKLIK